MSENSSQSEKYYALELSGCRFIVLTTLGCIKCFEKYHRCKISHITSVNKEKMGEWKNIAEVVLSGKCVCDTQQCGKASS